MDLCLPILWFGFLVVFEGSVSAEVVISPVNASVSENDPVTLTCTLTESTGTIDAFHWYYKKSSISDTFSNNVGIIRPPCDVSSIVIINTTLYEFACPSSTQVTWTIKKVTRQNQGDRYQCRIITTSEDEFSGYTFLNVQVPISSVTMIVPSTSTVTVRENESEEFKCKTSGARPAAIVTWYKDSGTPGDDSDDVEITSNIETSSSTVNDLREVTSTLIYSPTKNDNGRMIYCTASNANGQTPVVSQRKTLLNVQYPPDGPPVITGFSDGGEFRVVENTQGQLTCSVSGGNPAPTLTWDCINSGTPQTTSSSTVTKTHTWIAQRGQDKNCTCRASHYSGNTDVSIRIHILYETTVTSFLIEGHHGQSNIVVTEYDTDLQFTCTVDSNPVSTVKITFEGNILKEKSNTTSLSFTRSNTACLHSGVYICEGHNIYGHPSSQNLTLFVKCSPRPLQKTDQNITSYLHVPATLSFTVLAYPEPGPTGFSWYKENGNEWTPILSNADLLITSSAIKSNLTILNISEADFGRYRLTVTNSMGSYAQYMFLTEKGSSTAPVCQCEKDLTSIILGITLGIACAVLAAYAAAITILFKRKTTNIETRSTVKSSQQTTYANLSFKSDVAESQGQPGEQGRNNTDALDGDDDSTRQYTDLVQYSNDDRTTYEVLHSAE